MGQDCKYCGAYISSGVNVCPDCGKKVKPEKSDEAERYTRPEEEAPKKTYSKPNYRGFTTGAAAAAAFAEDQKARQEERARQEQQSREESRRSANEAYTYKQEYERRYGSYQETEGQTNRAYSENVQEDVARNKGLGYLCYLGPLVLVPLLTNKDSDFLRFHSNQGLLLFIVEVLGSILSGGLVGLAASIFSLVCMVKGLRAVSRGEKEELPLVGGIKLLK